MSNRASGLNPTPSRATADVGFKRWMAVITSSVYLVRLGVGRNGVGCAGQNMMRLGGLETQLINLIALIGLDVGPVFDAML